MKNRKHWGSSPGRVKEGQSRCDVASLKALLCILSSVESCFLARDANVFPGVVDWWTEKKYFG